MVNPPLKRFKEFKACMIKINIIPKEIDVEIKIFFKKIFSEKEIAKNKDRKNNASWLKLAWVIVSG